MFDTNAVLSIAFAIIANFTNVVQVPPAAVPQSTNDLQFGQVGMRLNPLRVYIKHKRGSQFWIMNGAVELYEAPGSYFSLQDPDMIPKYLGEPKFNTNQILGLATRAVRGLVKNGDPLTNIVPVVADVGQYHGQTIPFYRVKWPTTSFASRGVLMPAAEVGVDARTGQIETLGLYDRAFDDPARLQQISNIVFNGTAPPRPRKRKIDFPRPGTNEVARAIANWLVLCQKLGMDPGSETNLANVNWEESYVYNYEPFSPKKPICRTTFTNGTTFDTIEGKVINGSPWDTYYTADRHERWRGKREQLEGVANYRWTDMVTRFERLLTTKFGIPEKLLSQFRSVAGWDVPGVGSNGFARVNVIWRLWPKNNPSVPNRDAPVGFMVEFDLRTGQIKGFGFHDRALIEAFGRGQAQLKQRGN